MDEPMRIKDPEAYKRKLKEMKRRSAGGGRLGKPPQQEKPVKMASFDRAFLTGWAVVKEEEKRPKWSRDRPCPYLGREDGPKSCDAGPNSKGKICSDCFYDWHSSGRSPQVHGDGFPVRGGEDE